MTLKEQLEQIYHSHGTLTPDVVVLEAKHPDHPLHSRFNWDDKTAAHEHRLSQAAELIRSVKVRFREATETEGPRFVRAFHSLPSDEGRTYEPLEAVLADPFKMKLLMQEMSRDWMAMKRRYSDFAEFWQMVKEDSAA